jgi:hypothetical protein
MAQMSVTHDPNSVRINKIGIRSSKFVKIISQLADANVPRQWYERIPAAR